MQAFPVNVYEGKWNDGMELRDYFAAKAMATLLAVEPDKWFQMYMDKYPNMLVGVAAVAYDMADKMIEARGETEE